jgi:two-component system sensor histidine kinase EvgS
VFDISDTGIGMTREQQSALFAPFVQVHDNRSGHFGGTGLGLSICPRLTTMMGGSVAVESEPGCGSRFTVRLALPAAQPVAGPAAIEADERTKAASELAALAGLHALVIDDHLANRIVVSGQLVELGCTADTASDGAEGLARWVSDPAAFDLMMVDCSMPVMRGEEVARRVRAREASATVPAGPAGSARGPVPIVGMTADAQPEAAARAVEAGMNVCLVKPVAIDDLRRVLAAVLAGAPASLRAHAQSASLIDPQPAHPSEAERVPVGNAQPASQPLPSSKHDGRPAHRPPTFSGKAVARARSQRRPLFDFGTKLHPESRADAPLRSGRSSEDRPAQAAPSPAVSDATFDRALVDAFGAQADGLIDALRTANAEDFDKARAAMTARDYAYLHDTAHRMKGAAVVIGAAPFVAACAALQLACRAAFNPDPGSATHNDDHTATPPDTRVVAAFRAFVDEGAALENALSNHTPSPSVEPFPKQRVF